MKRLLTLLVLSISLAAPAMGQSARDSAVARVLDSLSKSLTRPPPALPLTMAAMTSRDTVIASGFDSTTAYVSVSVLDSGKVVADSAAMALSDSTALKFGWVAAKRAWQFWKPAHDGPVTVAFAYSKGVRVASATVRLYAKATTTPPVTPPPVTPPPVTPPPITPPPPVTPPPPAGSGHVLAVHAGGDFQAALNAAARGDTIVLDAGAIFTGTFTLPAKSGASSAGWITVRSSVPSAAAGVRVDTMARAALATIQTTTTNAALQTAPGASGWRLTGLQLDLSPSLNTSSVPNFGLVLLGDGSNAQNTLASVPGDLIIDHSWIHASATQATKRCVALNSASTTLTDNALTDCHAVGQDAQAIGGWNGPGPYLIQNNLLEGSGENILFGGNDPYIAGLIPSNVTIRQNYFYKPRAWQTGSPHWSVKNLLELKNVEHILIEGNVLRNNWADAQAGQGVVFGSVNQNGACSWCIVHDVTFRSNWVDSSAGVFNIFEGYAGSQHTRTIAIANNVFTHQSIRVYLIQGHTDSLTIDHNTGDFGGTAWVLLADSSARKAFTFTNNVGGNATYNLLGTYLNGWGVFALDQITGGGNCLIGASGGGTLPAGEHAVASMSAAGFVNASAGNYRLTSSSPCAGSGANLDTIAALVQSVGAGSPP